MQGLNLELIDLDQEKKGYREFLSTWVYRATDMTFLVDPGPKSTIPHLLEALSRKFGIPVEKFDPFKNISYDPKRVSTSIVKDRAPDMAVAAGLALRTTEE